MNEIILYCALFIAGGILGGVLIALRWYGRHIEDVQTLQIESELVRALVLSHRLRTNDEAGARRMTEFQIDSCIISLANRKAAGKLSEGQLDNLSRGVRHRKDNPLGPEEYNGPRGDVVRAELEKVLKGYETST